MNQSVYRQRQLEGTPLPFPFDLPLLFGIICLMTVSLVTLYSAGGVDTMNNQAIRFGIATVVMVFAVFVPVSWIKLGIPVMYIACVVMLIAVYFVGVEINGAKRWLNVGIRFQPSELAKMAIPTMLALYLGRHKLPPTTVQIFIGLLLIVIPTSLVFIQPDLGTSILVAFSGVVLLFLAGLSWRLIIVALSGLLVAVPTMWFFGMRDYQRERVLTLFDPERDRFGSGYNIIQSKIAIGSGGVEGKGWMQGTQSQLEFLPERTTDFIYAVYAEEFGFIGVVFLFLLYLFIILRGFHLSVSMPDNFSRLLSGALMTIFFTYFFVNVGMVSGILPVVGLPLPLVSYGGTSIVSLMLSFGLIMNLYRYRDTK